MPEKPWIFSPSRNTWNMPGQGATGKERFPTDNEMTLSCSSIAELQHTKKKKKKKKRRPQSAAGYRRRSPTPEESLFSEYSTQFHPGRVRPKQRAPGVRDRPQSANKRSMLTSPSAASLGQYSSPSQEEGLQAQVSTLYRQVFEASLVFF
jgi:hypothetical protein